jgi:hypothetical protein
LQASDAENDERQADVIDCDACTLKLFQPRRIFDDGRSKKEGKQSYRYVDKEDPAPIVIVGDPATKRGADRRGDHPTTAIP